MVALAANRRQKKRQKLLLKMYASGERMNKHITNNNPNDFIS